MCYLSSTTIRLGYDNYSIQNKSLSRESSTGTLKTPTTSRESGMGGWRQEDNSVLWRRLGMLRTLLQIGRRGSREDDDSYGDDNYGDTGGPSPVTRGTDGTVVEPYVRKRIKGWCPVCGRVKNHSQKDLKTSLPVLCIEPLFKWLCRIKDTVGGPRNDPGVFFSRFHEVYSLEPGLVDRGSESVSSSIREYWLNSGRRLRRKGQGSSREGSH